MRKNERRTSRALPKPTLAWEGAGCKTQKDRTKLVCTLAKNALVHKSCQVCLLEFYFLLPSFGRVQRGKEQVDSIK